MTRLLSELHYTACVFDFHSWPPLWLTLRPLFDSAGTEKPFSLHKHGYPRRRVGSPPQQEILLSSCFSSLSFPINTVYQAETWICEAWWSSGVEDNFTAVSVSKVLFIADVRISFDNFRRGMTATVNWKTIITVNPGKVSEWCLQKYWGLKPMFHPQLIRGKPKTLVQEFGQTALV